LSVWKLLAPDAKQTFDKLMMWYQVRPGPSGIGDSAYIESQGAIHVLKGKNSLLHSA